MPENWPKDIAQHGIHYQLLEPLTANRARFRFSGTFNGQDITWEATLLALGTTPENGERHAYFDIGSSGPDTTPIEIGLDVAGVDDAVILRSILMVRQYKRLRRGRMTFGHSL